MICAQPVMPGSASAGPLALGAAVDLDLDGRARADERHLAPQHVNRFGSSSSDAAAAARPRA